MRKRPAAQAAPEPAQADPEAIIFAHEVRRDGRVVATLRARRTAGGATVDSEVFPVNHPPGEGAVQRPFSFSSIEQARRFTDEALVAFEYLNCSVS